MCGLRWPVGFVKVTTTRLGDIAPRRNVGGHGRSPVNNTTKCVKQNDVFAVDFSECPALANFVMNLGLGNLVLSAGEWRQASQKNLGAPGFWSQPLKEEE